MYEFNNDDNEDKLSTKYPSPIYMDSDQYHTVQDYYDEIMMENDELDPFEVMIKGETAKFLQNPDLLKYLLQIDEEIKVVDNDEIWGENRLGKILECVKKIIREIPMITIASWNVNGIRTRIVDDKPSQKCKKIGERSIQKNSNLGELISKCDPDIICFQETRCGEAEGKCFQTDYYPYQYWNCSKKGGHRGTGYSGTSIWSKIQPKKITYNLPTLPEPDLEGRIIVAEFDNFTLITSYFPNSLSNEEYRINVWNPSILKYLKSFKRKKENVILCGDLNVAPTAEDIFFGHTDSKSFRPRAVSGKERIAGFLPEERESFKKIIESGFVDVYKKEHKNIKGDYTWWNPRLPSNRIDNKGWRIDHFIANKEMMKCVIHSRIYPDIGTKTFPQGSDHAPIVMTLNSDCISKNKSKNKSKNVQKRKPGAGIVVVKKFGNDWKVLALRLYKGYDLPKGEIEEGEGTLEAAIRETDEEADITQLDFKWGKQTFQTDRVTLYLAQTNQEGKIKRNEESGIFEHHQLLWVTWDEMLEKVYKYLKPGIIWAQNIIEK